MGLATQRKKTDACIRILAIEAEAVAAYLASPAFREALAAALHVATSRLRVTSPAASPMHTAAMADAIIAAMTKEQP